MATRKRKSTRRGKKAARRLTKKYPPTPPEQLNNIAAEIDTARTNAKGKSPQQFAQQFAAALAQKVANTLKHAFPGILPDPSGGEQESLARTSKGFKRLDVNYSTVRLGLALGVSIKTTNAPEGPRNNYAKNVTGRDGELRAEAEDYHERQPYAVLIALYFVPFESCNNATRKAPSSFGTIAKTLRYRAGRAGPKDLTTLFEAAYVGLYVKEGAHRGDVAFFDVAGAPPWSGRPDDTIPFHQVIERIKAIYDERNKTFRFAGSTEPVIASESEADVASVDDAGVEES